MINIYTHKVILGTYQTHIFVMLISTRESLLRETVPVKQV